MTFADDRNTTGQCYRRRTYRNLIESHLTCELIAVQETDLAVYSDRPPIAEDVKQCVIEQRGYLEAYIRRFPDFINSLLPWPADSTAPQIVREMIDASEKTGVGPMAAVAGAIAEQVGRHLRHKAGEIIIENGGDIFFRVRRPVTIGLFAGDSPLSLKIGLQLDPTGRPQGICTSSGSVGHSISMGRADAVCVLSASSVLADAAATAIANRVLSTDDIQKAIVWGRGISGIEGIVIVVDEKMGVWGNLKVVPI